jgi:hypothetical protein
MSSSPRIDVSILLVSYNTKALTLAALDSIARETKHATYEIIVVDNASSDGTGAAIAAHPAHPKLIQLEENIGFGRANNLAAEQAQGDYILLLNTDTVVLDGAIDKLVAHARKNRRALIWGGRTLFADHTLNPSSCWRRMSPWTLICLISGLSALFPRSSVFNSVAYGSWQRDSVRTVDIVSGCFLLIPYSIWLALGGFDPVFFMYGEDADLCLRAQRIGACPEIVPGATIIHLGGASETTRTDKMIKLLAAKATLIERHWSLPLREHGLNLLALWPLSRWIGFAIAAAIRRREDFQYKADTWREIWDRRIEWRFGYAKQAPIKAERDVKKPLLPHAEATP